MLEGLLLMLGAFALVAFLILYGAFAKGFVIYKFYTWFLLPVFTSLPVINWYEAVGIALFITLIKSSTTKDQYFQLTEGGTRIKIQDDRTMTWTRILLGPWIVLLLGWFIKLFL